MAVQWGSTWLNVKKSRFSLVYWLKAKAVPNLCVLKKMSETGHLSEVVRGITVGAFLPNTKILVDPVPLQLTAQGQQVQENMVDKSVAMSTKKYTTASLIPILDGVIHEIWSPNSSKFCGNHR